MVQKNEMIYQGFQSLFVRGVQLVQTLEVLSVVFYSDDTETPKLTQISELGHLNGGLLCAASVALSRPFFSHAVTSS